MTIQEAARVALDCQDARNLSGVLASFKEIVHEVIWPEARRLGKGTEYVNTHPVVTLFLSKLCCSIAGTSSATTCMQAMHVKHSLAARNPNTHTNTGCNREDHSEGLGKAGAANDLGRIDAES